ncbi:MAG TPA: MauE/DoxX family redox-associated membrane protein [Bryobacteraceae bacterium]|nr:MauE/DoxX family redox-associated membrane protein [Bryobacteraceae bacterium]
MKRWLLIAGRLALAALFLYSGIAKLREPWLQFAISIEGFKIVPDYLLEPMARTLPWLEVIAGAGLFVNVLAGWAALATALMLVVFNTAGIWAYSKGLQVDCGCFGSGAADPIGPKWFVEHGGMLLLALLVTIGCFQRGAKTAPEPGRAGAPAIA